MFALGFSLRGTLIATEHLERDAFLALVRERSHAVGTPYHESEAFAAAENLFLTGDRETVPLERVADSVTRLVGDTVAEPVLIARFRQIADRLAPSRVSTLPHVRENLERLEALGIPMAVLSNGWSRIARREAECAGFKGPVLASEDFGAEKPAPRAFWKLVEALRLPADCVWYVGTDPRRDVNGAIRAGLTAVWLNPDGAAYPAELARPTLTIRSLEELLPPVYEEYARSLRSVRGLMRTALDWHAGAYVPPSELW